MPGKVVRYTPTYKLTSEQARAMWNYWHIGTGVHPRIRRLDTLIRQHPMYHTVKPCTLVRAFFSRADNSMTEAMKSSVACLESILEHLHHASMLYERNVKQAFARKEEL